MDNSRNSKKEFLLEANYYKEQGLLMDSNIKVGSNGYDYPLTDEQEFNKDKYTEIKYQPSGTSKREGICSTISQAIKAVYEAPLCMKVMGCIGLLSLVGSGITAYNAYSALKSNCGSLKPTSLIPPVEPTQKPVDFKKIASELPVVILTSQQAEIEVRGESLDVGNRCFVNKRLLGSSHRESCRKGYTGQKFEGNCRRTDFDLQVDVTEKPKHCELSGIKIGNFFDKKLGLHETCNIYDATGVNTEMDDWFSCVNLPKTASEARQALYKLGHTIGERLKSSPNYKYNMTDGVTAYAKIQEMADAYDKVADGLLLGHELKSGFRNGLRPLNETVEVFPTISNGTNTTQEALPQIEATTKSCPPPDGTWHSTNANSACALGALGFVMMFGACLTADFKKANIVVRVGIPKDSANMMAIVYNNVAHYYNIHEPTFASNITFDTTQLVKYLMDKGEECGDVYEFALEICDKIDSMCGNTIHGDRVMNSVRAYMRENYNAEFSKYRVSVGIENPENKDNGCWFSSIFSWGSSQAPSSKTHTPVPQVTRAVQEEIDEPIYAGIPMQFIRSSGATTPPLSASTPHTQVRAQVVGAEDRYSMGEISEDGMDLGDLAKGFSISTNSLTDGTYRYDLKD